MQKFTDVSFSACQELPWPRSVDWQPSTRPSRGKQRRTRMSTRRVGASWCRVMQLYALPCCKGNVSARASAGHRACEQPSVWRHTPGCSEPGSAPDQAVKCLFWRPGTRTARACWRAWRAWRRASTPSLATPTSSSTTRPSAPALSTGRVTLSDTDVHPSHGWDEISSKHQGGDHAAAAAAAAGRSARLSLTGWHAGAGRPRPLGRGRSTGRSPRSSGACRPG